VDYAIKRRYPNNIVRLILEISLRFRCSGTYKIEQTEDHHV